MTPTISHRRFEPGTTGWTVDDLSEPETQWEWGRGRYELVEGVLTKMSPQGFHGVKPIHRLRRIIEQHLDALGRDAGEFFTEVDLLLKPNRVPRPDLLFLTRAQHQRQEQIELQRKVSEADYCPILVMPLLVVESVSVGHEAHDYETKREWYAKAKIPHYWLLTAHERSLLCLALEGADYVEEATGRDSQEIRTAAFGGLTLPLGKLWRKA